MSGGDNECEKALAGKPEQKRRLGRPRLRWKDNIKMGLTEIRFGLDSRREFIDLLSVPPAQEEFCSMD
jgi:hypothetical protein